MSCVCVCVCGMTWISRAPSHWLGEHTVSGELRGTLVISGGPIFVQMIGGVHEEAGICKWSCVCYSAAT